MDKRTLTYELKSKWGGVLFWLEKSVASIRSLSTYMTYDTIRENENMM